MSFIQASPFSSCVKKRSDPKYVFFFIPHIDMCTGMKVTGGNIRFHIVEFEQLMWAILKRSHVLCWPTHVSHGKLISTFLITRSTHYCICSYIRLSSVTSDPIVGFAIHLTHYMILLAKLYFVD